MPTFIFSSVSLSSLSPTKTYYLQVVSSTPLVSDSTIASLTTLLSTPQVLTGATYVSQTLNFTDQVFNTRTYVSTHVGFILAERIGANFSSTDPLIAFIPHTNAFGQEVIEPVGTYAINLDFPSTGVFSTVNAYLYQVGNYVNNGAVAPNNGIINLIGTKNGTVGTYLDPTTSSPRQIETLRTDGTANLSIFKTTGTTTELNHFTSYNAYAMMFRFRNSMDICFNTGSVIKWQGNDPRMKLWGSNLLTNSWTVASLTNSSNWTELVDLGTTGLTVPFSSSGTFYKYLKIGALAPQGNIGYQIISLDLYNCSVRTPNQNFV
jgi:hypothetical protein